VVDRSGPCDYDDEVRLHDEVLRRAYGIQPREHVLDIGCGLGQTTCAAAHMAHAGSAFGVDISASAIERARELARAQGIPNVTFERADAQVHAFRGGASIWPSGGSARCSSLTRWQRSPTSDGRCTRPGGW
jgi:SAM-dependent methyltransferase